MSFNYQLYDLRNLDDNTRKQIVDMEVNNLLEGEVCSICDGEFIGEKERNEAICSGKNPLRFAHSYCWEGEVNE